MNTLSFGLLCILATHNYTGYELMLKIQPFWQAKHSQIYPLLAALVKEGLVLFEDVAQSDKPDKKIYSITEKGLNELKQWMAESSAEPVTRDEMMLKAYCISIVDVDVIQTLFDEQEQMYANRLAKYKNYCELIPKIDGGIAEIDFHSPQFGLYIILKKAIMNAEVNLEWCRWVKSQIKK
ncbi:PadR family transcriptional regulator [Paenibacillus psychroresistens]|uniref:PadR family transcriptional regulator n=1 Tax=Paenibacillus psychroresistens TaxID=1778678 RepID=A0A6B8RVW9_9BACL|nr:PadR family transcriptional regulator [Paenibacillus psychroresistens]QGQ99593.1 PadR family transcriptional regulator [Paenibacillus psychroresistens]